MSEGSELSLAAEVATELEQHGVVALLIGAAALAAHGFTRATNDLDFGVAVHPDKLRELATLLERPNRKVELREADGDDPLGGVVTIVRSECTPVQLVNFDNPPGGGFPALVRDAQSRAAIVADLPGRLVSAEDLVLFKLYAGGMKSELDIVHLLTQCTLDLPTLREHAEGYRLDRKLDALLQKIGL